MNNSVANLFHNTSTLVRSLKGIARECRFRFEMEKQKQQLANEKLEWTKKNDLAKKIDSCNLNMTHTAFDGTYEEYQAWINQLAYNNFGNMENGQVRQMMAQTGQYNNPFNNGFFR